MSEVTSSLIVSGLTFLHKHLIMLNIVFVALLVGTGLWVLYSKKEDFNDWWSKQLAVLMRRIKEQGQRILLGCFMSGLVVINAANPTAQLCLYVKSILINPNEEFSQVKIVGSLLIICCLVYPLIKLLVWISNLFMATATGSKENYAAEEKCPQNAFNVTIDQGTLGLQSKNMDSIKSKIEQQRNELEAIKLQLSRNNESIIALLKTEINTLTQQIKHLIKPVLTVVAEPILDIKQKESQQQTRRKVSFSEEQKEQLITNDTVKDIITSML